MRTSGELGRLDASGSLAEVEAECRCRHDGSVYLVRNVTCRSATVVCSGSEGKEAWTRRKKRREDLRRWRRGRARRISGPSPPSAEREGKGQRGDVTNGGKRALENRTRRHTGQAAKMSRATHEQLRPRRISPSVGSTPSGDHVHQLTTTGHVCQPVLVSARSQKPIGLVNRTWTETKSGSNDHLVVSDGGTASDI